MLKEYDIAIAGGGPAGSAAAICLARLGWRVALFEATTFEKSRPGETLPPEINPLLREFGVWQKFREQDPVEAPGIISAWNGTHAQETDFAFNPHGSGWHVDRRRFDRMLFDAAQEEGARVFAGERVEFARQGSVWRVKRRSAETLDARFVIDATGRNGMRIEGSRERTIDDLLIATTVQISFSDSRPRDLRTLIEATACGWWYSACLPESGFIAMFFTGRESYQSGDDFIAEQLQQAPLTRGRVQESGIKQSTTAVMPVISSLRQRIFGEGWLAAGDSACSFDPLSGRGIFKALKHGAAAAGAADASVRGEPGPLERYQEMVRREFGTYLLQKESFYASHIRWRECRFWKARRAAAVKANAA